MIPEDLDSFSCPYCGETNVLSVDLTGGSQQRLIVDCEVCCNPIVIRVRVRGQGISSVDVRKENE